MPSTPVPTAFYCVSSRIYFLGAVGLINSLRLQGHDQPIYLLDTGLSETQRALLETEARVFEAPADVEPFMLKTFLPARHPAEAMVLIDADMIVTRPLPEPIERARAGTALAVRHPQDRFVAEWGEAIGSATATRHPYVSSGLIFLGGDPGRAVIALMEEKGALVEFERTQFGVDFPDYPFIASTQTSPADYPFFYADQDLLNAVLAVHIDPASFEALAEELAPVPPFAGLRITDEESLRCAGRNGTEPYVLHHYLSKPWLEPTHHGIYSKLLHRLLVGPNIAIEVPPEEIPLRFRAGPRATLERHRVNAREQFRYRIAEPVAAKLSARRPGRGTGTERG